MKPFFLRYYAISNSQFIGRGTRRIGSQTSLPFRVERSNVAISHATWPSPINVRMRHGQAQSTFACGMAKPNQRSHAAWPSAINVRKQHGQAQSTFASSMAKRNQRSQAAWPSAINVRKQHGQEQPTFAFKFMIQLQTTVCVDSNYMYE